MKSLLKLSGKQFCNKYSSTLFKAHGPASIFTLSSNKHNLCQLNYHHEGGDSLLVYNSTTKKEKNLKIYLKK